MIVFINEEHAYRSWVTHHRTGFVLDGCCKPLGQMVAHRATCSHVKHAETKDTHFTSEGKLKACSLSHEELEAWVTSENHLPLAYCPACHPEKHVTENENLTVDHAKLGRDVLDYVVDAAAIHLELPDSTPYRLTVADVAGCLGKTVQQVLMVVPKLIDDGMIWLPGIDANSLAIPSSRLVLPTAKALKARPGSGDEGLDELQTHVDKLLLDHS